MIADLDAQVSVAHAAGKLLAGCVDILQGNLAERFKPAFRALAHFKGNVIEQARAIERVFGFASVGEEHWRGGDDLHVHAVAVHVFEAHVHIPATGSDVAEHAIAEHDVRFARAGVFDRRPIRRAVAFGEIGPGFREKMCVNIYDWHVVPVPLFLRSRFARMNFTTVLAFP